MGEIEILRATLGEAHVELRVWKRSADHRLGPSRTSRFTALVGIPERTYRRGSDHGRSSPTYLLIETANIIRRHEFRGRTAQARAGRGICVTR